MNTKTFYLSPIAVAIMSTCMSVSAQTVDVDQNSTITSQAATNIIINDNVSIDVAGAPAVVIDDPEITLSVGTTPNSGASVLSDQIAVDVQPMADGTSINDPVINNNGVIQGGTVGIRFDRDANSGGTGDLINVANAEDSIISGGTRAIEIEADTIDVDNEGLITVTAPSAEASNGVIFVSDQANNVDIFNRATGVIDAGEGNESAAVSIQLSTAGRTNDITNDEGGVIAGRGNAAASGADAGDGIRFERERDQDGNLDSSGATLEDIGSLDATTEQFISEGNVTNAGTISSEGANGTVAGIRVVDNVSFVGNITNEETGVISGTQNGVYFGNGDHTGGTVDNAGLISSDSRAFNIDGTGLTLNNTGTILATGNQRNGTLYADGTATDFAVNNSGTIDAGEGLDGSGFAAEIGEDGNAFTFDNSGDIIGRGTVDAADGFRVGNPGNIGTATVAITNSGNITSESTTDTTAGIRFVNGISFDGTIDNSGTISGAQNGVYFGNAVDGEGADHSNGVFTNLEDGVITSDSRAVNIDGTGLTFINDGTVVATGNQRNGTVYADGTATDFTVINTGTIDAGEGLDGSGFAAEIGEDGNAFTFDNSGDIIGRGTVNNADGFRVGNGGNVGTATVAITNSGNITSESTTGTTAGVRFVNGISFDGTIENSGTISGVQNGVYFGNAVDGEGADHSNGVLINSEDGVISSDSRALNIDGTGLTVVNEGSILATGTQRNGTVYADSTAQDFILINDGLIDAGDGLEGAGFSAELSEEGNNFSIINSGDILGRGDAAAGLASAGDGIRLERTRVDGSLANPSTGTFTGEIVNSGTISSEGANGTVAGLRTVDNVNFQGSIINEADGVISGTQNGLYFGLGDHAGSTVDNAGLISSDSRALNIDGSGLTINNSGTILATGNQRNGTAYADGTATDFTVINSGTIDAGEGLDGSGFAAEIGEDGNAFTFDNSGDIIGRGTVNNADGFRVGNGGNVGTATVAITNSGNITSESTTGTTAGVRFVNGISFDGTIENSGTISGVQNGVYFGNAVDGEGADHSNGVLINSEDGVISSDSRALNIDGTGLTVVNEGSILATGTQRNGTVYADSTAQDFILINDGLIDAGDGLEGAGFSAELSEEGNNFSIINSGDILGRGDAAAGLASAGDGIRLERTRVDGSLANPSTGTFTGEIVNSGTISSEGANGTVAGLRTVDNVNFQGSIINEADGVISGTQNGLYFGLGDHAGSTVDNAGLISSDSRALNIDGSGLTINNSGTILATGNQRNGTAYADGTATDFTVINSGTIDAGEGLDGSGFAAEIGADGNAFTFDNSGDIIGRGTVDAADGFRVGNPGNIGTATVAITNSGNITSESTTGTTAGLRFVNGISFDGTIDNSGTISGAQNGVYFGNPVDGEGADHSNGVLNNLEGGVISSDSRALNIDGVGLTVNNAGTILGTGNQRNGTVYADGTANDFTFNNQATGLVDGGVGNDSSAVSIQVGSADGDVQAASITNAGTLQGRGDGVSAGIRLFTNTAGATFSGNIDNSGSIFAEGSAGILIESGITLDGAINNSGDISALSGIAVDFSETNTGINFNQLDGDVSGDILLGSGSDVINISGGSVSGSIIGQSNGTVNVDLGDGNTFTSNGVTDVLDYNILSGTVNQVGDFSTSSATTTVSSGATLAFDSVINGAGALVSDGTLSFGSDGRLVQDGDVTLNSGSVVEFLFGETLELGEEVTLIDANAITDNGVSVIDDSVLLDLVAVVDEGGNGDLVLQTVEADLEDVLVIDVIDENELGFLSSLQQAIAIGDSAVAGNEAVLLNANADELEGVSPSASGAATLGAYQLADANLKLVRNQYASGNAIATPDELRNGLWLQGLSGSSSQDNQDGVVGFDSDFDGFALGYTAQINENIRAGLAYTASDAEISDNDSFGVDTDIDSDQITFYGDYQLEKWFFGGSVSLADLDYDLSRASTLEGLDAVSATTDGQLLDVTLNAGYKLIDGAWGLTPIASISYSSLDIDSFDEEGGVNLTDVEYDDIDRLRSELGLLFAGTSNLGGWALSPSLKLSWKHDFNDDETFVSANIGDSGQFNFTQPGVELESDVFNVGAGVSLSNDSGLTFRLDYQGEFASDEDSQFGSASVEYRF